MAGKQTPTYANRKGNISVSLWETNIGTTTRRNVQIKVSWKNKEEDKWKEAKINFSADKVEEVKTLLNEVTEFLKNTQ